VLGTVLTVAWLEVSSASVSYATAARVDSRVRSNEAPSPDAPRVAGDTDVTPLLGLEIRDGNAALQVEYAPRISLREVTARARTELQHTGRLAGLWQPARGLSLRLTEELVLGSVNLLTADLGALPGGPGSEPGGQQPPPGSGGPLQPLPQADTVYFLSSATTLTADTGWLGRRWNLTGSGGFSISGGLDGPAREAVPLQYGPRADASISHALSPLSALTTSAAFSYARFSTGANNTIVTLREAWGHRVDRRTALEAGAGVSVVRSLPMPPAEGEPEPGPLDGPRTELLPNLNLGVSHRIPSRTADFNGRADLRLVPFTDRLTARVYPRADLTLTGTWALGPRVQVSAIGGGATAVGGSSGDSILSGGLTGSWILTRWVSVDTDLRGTWSRSPELPTARLTWAATLGLSVRQTGIL